jgi:tetratricopeptide (TPR) repeat protein
MDNSAFISYRRSASKFIARAVFQDLKFKRGIDAFMDVESIDSGTFDTIILNQIAARPYFLLILTPGTLERCTESGDWLLREMNEALRLKRIIIPLVTPEFVFKEVQQYLSGPLASELPRYNAVKLDHDYFEAGMDRLVTRFLVPVELNVTPTPAAETAAVESKIAQATAEPEVTQEELNAQAFFERGYKNYHEGDLEGAIADYTEAIKLNPQDSITYNNRGVALDESGQHDAAIEDYTEALRLDPNYANGYSNRGAAYASKHEFDNAIADYGEAIRLDPNDAVFYYNRGETYFNLKLYRLALPDFQEANRLDTELIHPQTAIPLTLYEMGQGSEAIKQWRKLIEKDERFRDPLWANDACAWDSTMLATARELISKL